MLIVEFLEEIGERKLKLLGVINTRRNLLNGKSVEPLIRMMQECGVEELTGPNNWFLKENYDYYNPYSKEIRHGNIKTSDITRPGVVFDSQNNILNPYYSGYSSQSISKSISKNNDPIFEHIAAEFKLKNNIETQDLESVADVVVDKFRDRSSESQPLHSNNKTVMNSSGGYGYNLEDIPKNFLIDDRYRIEGKIGSGGFGTVYKAWDNYTDCFKALKVIHKQFYGDKEVIADLKRETKILMSMRSEHVVRIWDIHLKGEIKFIDMEYIDNGDLVDLKLSYTDKKVPEQVVMDLAKQIAQGMMYIHEKKVIHKDLKPQNIMLTKDGIVKIMDFGIAETFRSSMSRIKETSRSGTPAYMSPEQLLGKDVGRESDIWSFGVMLYELLSGKQIYSGQSYKDVLFQIKERDYYPINGVSKEMNGVLEQCLKYDYNERIKSFQKIDRSFNENEINSIKTAEDINKKEKKSVSGCLIGTLLGACIIWVGYGAVVGSTSVPPDDSGVIGILIGLLIMILALKSLSKK